MARALALPQDRHLLPHPQARRRAPRGHREDPHRRARQGALRREGRGRARARGDRVLLRDPGAAQGRLLGAGLVGDRRLLDPPAARRRRGITPFNFPAMVPDVDVGARARVREHLRAQAVGEGSLRVALRRRAAPGGRCAGRRLQRRPRRQGRGRLRARAPGDQGRLVRRLDADREVRLRDGDEARQALPGARRREEPHDRAPRRRRRHGGRRGGQCGVRLGRRALHGDLAGRGGRRRRRQADRRDQGADPEGQGRRRDAGGLRDGPARHARAPRQGRRVRRERAPTRAGRSSSTGASPRPRARASGSASRCSTTSSRG